MPRFRLIALGLLLASATFGTLGFASSAGADEAAAAPKVRDTPPRRQPKQAQFSARIVPAEARRGATVNYEVTAKVEAPWHIYAYSANPPEIGRGPTATQFDLFDLGGLVADGNWTPSSAPISKVDRVNWPDLKAVESHEGEVTWKTTLRVPVDAEPGTKTIRSQIFFQICTDKQCLQPTRITLPDVALNILEGEPIASAEAPPPVKPPEPTSANSTATAPVRNIADTKIREGLIPFLLFSMGGGLLALVMPCVWPMVPVTVNFFVKQGQKQTGKTFGLALTYCLSIIVIFTLVGVLFSAFLGAASLQRLANTAWLNLLVTALFLMFGLSLLGLFELRLPSFLLNASAQGESRGGILGVFFMALTLTITSFTCTFPVVGALLVLAAGGSYLYPILGLATFAAVLALPFFLLALAPGILQRVPRSGDWMNTVKVVGGLIEIGAAFKFLNTAEIALGATPDTAWIDAQLVLVIWIVLAAVCGAYLLGFFRTDHDLEEVKVGPLRILFGAAFFGLALFLAPALFGNPPQSPLFGLVAALLPPDVGELDRPEILMAQDGGESAGKVLATSEDPDEAQRQEKLFHGVQWGMSYEQALETAKAENRPILIDYTGVNCANCRNMERDILGKPEIRALLKNFVTVSLYTDIVPIGSLPLETRRELADKNADQQNRMVNDLSNPFHVVVTPDGRVVAGTGYTSRANYAAFLTDALAKWNSEAKVAQAP